MEQAVCLCQLALAKLRIFVGAVRVKNAGARICVGLCFSARKWWVAEKICLVPKTEQWVSCFLLFSVLLPPTTCCLYGISDPCKYKNNLIFLFVSLLLTLLHTFYHETKKKKKKSACGNTIWNICLFQKFSATDVFCKLKPLPVTTVTALLAGRHYCLQRNTRRLHPHSFIVRLMTQQEHNRWHSWFFFFKQTKS